eukprot:TRINITY_DN1273_c0_g1_i1.p1 TRINITY_DN1273_c0_g1~~TRINITY_DN1273_c0_g1_i1.p1  ORF type:complete len:408 (+),score=119.10 TRINITY_DN1273_c0_g1_i1:23-1246(+)
MCIRDRYQRRVRAFSEHLSDKHTMNFPELKNDLFLRAIRCEKVERTPVWVMRQAGRYLPEFRESRKKADFFTLCKTPDLVAEVTLQPIDRYQLDAAIIFSDILVIPQVLGFNVEMKPEVGPVILNRVEEASAIDQLTLPDVQKELNYVYESEVLTRHKLGGRVPLIGFTGAPWTLFAYCVEGKGSKEFARAKKFLYLHPERSHRLLRLLTDAIVDHLIGQVVKGHVQALQVFDSWAGLLPQPIFEEFALSYLKEICHRVKTVCPEIPIIVFAKGANFSIPQLATPYPNSDHAFDVIGLDWCIEPDFARKQVDEVLQQEKAQTGRERTIALQGNLDPSVLYGSPETIRDQVKKMINKFGTHGHIANLGHGMNPDHDPELLKVFIDYVHEYSEQKIKEQSSSSSSSPSS